MSTNAEPFSIHRLRRTWGFAQRVLAEAGLGPVVVDRCPLAGCDLCRSAAGEARQVPAAA